MNSEISPENFDSFDRMISAAMRARPEPEAGMDLASEAIRRAHALQAQDDRLARLARITRWARVATFAAAAMITLVIGIAYRFWPADVSTDATTDAASTVATTASLDMTTVGIALFLITLIAVVLATLFTPDRPQLRITAA